MPQIRESRFRVLEVNQWDVYLSDFEGSGFPVHVELEDESYSELLDESIAQLEPGNKIEAEIRSESVTMRDSLWLFLSMDIIENTSFHFIDSADSYPEIVSQFMDHLNDINENSVRKFLSSEDERIGYITVADAQDGELWSGLRAGTRSHEVDLEYLSRIDDPPYEVVYTRTPDENYLVFYHFTSRGTDLANSVIQSNT